MDAIRRRAAALAGSCTVRLAYEDSRTADIETEKRVFACTPELEAALTSSDPVVLRQVPAVLTPRAVSWALGLMREWLASGNRAYVLRFAKTSIDVDPAAYATELLPAMQWLGWTRTHLQIMRDEAGWLGWGNPRFVLPPRADDPAAVHRATLVTLRVFSAVLPAVEDVLGNQDAVASVLGRVLGSFP